CQSGAWENVEKPEPLCGFSSEDHLAGNVNIIPCQGHNPLFSCPYGYDRFNIFKADSNALFSCVITKILSGD
ncbi:shufflon system plasmid conjugative transfer pilus tip adhesin PilV, partial [Pectobacterium carotovorum]|nr:shufflon system plasmid conjugative transfer pilus tip adhesin PilV [Pectobacterium carotovorum]